MSHYLTEEEIKAKTEEVASLQENSMIAKEYLVPKRVRREIADALPGFVSHKAFFRSLTGGFTPISVSTSGKRRICRCVSGTGCAWCGGGDQDSSAAGRQIARAL